MQIRQIQVGDYRPLYFFVRQAFSTANVADGTEQDFVLRLRAGAGYIPALELVAEEDGVLAGHIMLTRLELVDASRPVQAALLAPLCVRLEQRGQGVGARLVEAAFERARALGFEAVFLCGDPAYYSRFGFRAVEELGLVNESGIPSPYVQGVALREGALAGLSAGVKLE